MASLRSNVVFSTLAMLLVGLVRPGFNAIVTRAFGAEANGRAATIIALIFLASLPATAALPTVMVRQVSRALGQGRTDEAKGQARAAFLWAAVLTLIGSLSAFAYGTVKTTPPLGVFELTVVTGGLFGYVYWRLGRNLLLAVGSAGESLRADFVSVLSMFLGLAIFVAWDREALAVTAFAGFYWIYAALTLRAVLRGASGGALSEEGQRDALRYNILWFVGTAASLAAREMALLLLDARVDRALVGEVSLSLSLLLMLALAPRIIEVPFIHELASLGVEPTQKRQYALIETATHWLTLFSLSAGFGMAILAKPILALVGNVTTPSVAEAFAIVSLAFMTEMMMTPATNLLVAEAPPSVITWAGVLSLLVAIVWWWSPLGSGVGGVMNGLAISFVIKAAVIALATKKRFAVRLFLAPLKKGLLVLAGMGATGLAFTETIDPWLTAIGFQVLFLAMFTTDLKAAYSALRGVRSSA